MKYLNSGSSFLFIKNIATFFLVILLSSSHISYAAGLIIKKISSDDGLSNSAISVIHKDSTGVMWFGTWDGLNSYDGKRIRVYKSDKKNPKTITSNVIIDIVEPANGILWVSTTNGVNKLNTETREVERFFETEGKNASTSTKSYKLTLGPKNLVICYTLNNNLRYFDENSGKFIPLEVNALKSKKIVNLASDAQGSVFLVTRDMELYRLQLRIVQNKPEIISCIRVLNQFSARNIFRKSDNEFWLIDIGSKYIYLFNSVNGLLKIAADISGLSLKGGIQTINEFNNEIVVGMATTGLFYFDILSKAWVQIQNPEYHGGVLSSFYDTKQQILWTGTNNNGVISSYREQLNFRRIANKDLSNRHASAIRAICEDELGRIWVGSRGNGLSIITNTLVNNKVVNIPELTNKSILSICKGPNDIMFIGSESEGLFLVNFKTLKVSKMDLSLSKSFTENLSPPIYSLLWDNSLSTLWIGTNSDGAFQFQFDNKNPKLTTQRVFEYNKDNNSGLKNNNIYSIITFDKNHVWMSTRGSGLFLINKTTHKVIANINQDSHSPLSDNDVLCLLKTSDNIFWAGTSYGLNKLTLKGKAITVNHYNETNGLPNNTVHGILEDSNGIIWISTNYGLSKLNPKTKQITNYNNGYGLQSNEFSDGSYYKTAKGELFFGGVNGLNHFFTSEFEERDFMPEVIIIDVKINNSTFPLAELTKTDRKGKYLSLKYYQNFFSIDFQALDFINNANCEYSYILEGFNNDWVALGSANTATFTNVLSGNYVLKIKATNGDKVWNKKEFSLRVKVDRPWWASWYAYIVYLVLFSGISYFIYSILKKRIQLNRTIFEERVAKKEQLVSYEAKLRFFTNIAHEFCTPLTLIYGPCEKLLESDITDATTKRYLHVIKNNAERMQRLINDLMDFRRVETDNKRTIFEEIDVQELAKYITDNFVEFAEQKQIDFKLNFKNSSNLFVSDRDALEKILFNLVSNAYKYTNENGKIDIEVENTDKELSIRVRNTGLGIKQEDIDSVFNRFQILDNFERNVSQGKIQRTGIGLALTKSLVSLLNGKITVDSRENHYTLFTVELPVQKNVEIRPKQEIPLFVQAQEISPQMDTKQKSLILIIDDETEIRNLLHDILSPFYGIIEAADGNEGIEQLKHHRPDLIISDIIMPNMSGVELLNEIKKSRLTSHIPVVFLSSKATMDDQIANYERGLEFFIAKPFNPKLLLSVINQIIINRGSLKQFYNSTVSTIEEFNSNFVHSDEKKFLVSIADLIKNNMENELLGPDFICEKLNITRIILYRRIKELINSTPTDFIREVRLKEAERLIKTTKLTIQEIMYQTGFNNKSYFYTIFKTEYGVSPNEYRKKS